LLNTFIGNLMEIVLDNAIITSLLYNKLFFLLCQL
jgi:hypothetical protein